MGCIAQQHNIVVMPVLAMLAFKAYPLRGAAMFGVRQQGIAVKPVGEEAFAKGKRLHCRAAIKSGALPAVLAGFDH